MPAVAPSKHSGSELAVTGTGLRPWFVCFSAALFFFYEFIQMNMLNSLGDAIAKEYVITATELGNLSACYFYANLMFLLVAGLLLDRYSTRLIILVSMVTCVLGTVLFALSDSILLAGICRFVSGVGSAFCFLSSVRLASRWFPPSRLALIVGLVVTMAMLGGVVAQTPLTILAAHIGWRHSLLVVAGIGVLITIIIWQFVQDRPAGQEALHQVEQQELQAMGFWQAQKAAFLRRQNWLGGIYTCLLNQPVSLLGALWGNSYLQKVHNLTATDASYVTTMIFLGTVIGSPLAGWISDQMGYRRRLMLIGAVLSVALVLAVIYLPNLTMPKLLILFFALGFITSTQVISYPTVAESNPKILTATSVSVVSICAIGGYAVFQPLFGRIMDWSWSGQMEGEIRIYTATDYHLAIKVLPIMFVVALIAAFFLRETYCRTYENNKQEG